MCASRVISFPSKEGVPCGYQHAISWQAIDRSEERKLSRVQVCSRCATLSVRSSGRREHGQSYHRLPFHGNHFLHEDTPPKADRNSLTKANCQHEFGPVLHLFVEETTTPFLRHAPGGCPTSLRVGRGHLRPGESAASDRPKLSRL